MANARWHGTIILKCARRTNSTAATTTADAAASATGDSTAA